MTNLDNIVCGTNVLPVDDTYQKDAKAFIKCIKKRQQIIQESQALRLPMVLELGYKTEYEIWRAEDSVRFAYNKAIQNSDVKHQLDKLSKSHLNINRRLAKLKYGYWACYPKGCEEYYAVYPNLTRK